MADRREQIVALLATRFDHLPEPVRREHAAPGFVHRTLAPEVCPTCDGLDEQRVCPTCRGRGFVEVWRGRDPMSVAEGSVVPSVMRGVSPYGLASTAKLGHVPARDAELGRLAEQTATPLKTEADLVAAANEHPFGWERARAAMYAQFDYRALDVALERLHGMLPGVSAYSPRALELLGGWLPDPLRAPGQLAEVTNLAARGRGADRKALAQRDERIRQLAAEGHSMVVIAVAVGLSERHVRRVVNAREEVA